MPTCQFQDLILRFPFPLKILDEFQSRRRHREFRYKVRRDGGVGEAAGVVTWGAKKGDREMIGQPFYSQAGGWSEPTWGWERAVFRFPQLFREVR